MREKSYVARLGALALVLTLMTTCLTGGTLAKFVTEVEGGAEATVAAWEFKATGNNGAALSSIDMGRTAYKGETIGDNVIAPGRSCTEMRVFINTSLLPAAGCRCYSLLYHIPFRNRGIFRFWGGFPILWTYGKGFKNELDAQCSYAWKKSYLYQPV